MTLIGNIHSRAADEARLSSAAVLLTARERIQFRMSRLCGRWSRKHDMSVTTKCSGGCRKCEGGTYQQLRSAGRPHSSLD